MVVKLSRVLLLVCLYTTLVMTVQISKGEDILQLGSSLTSGQFLSSSSSAFLLSFRPPPASPSSTNLFLTISFASAPAGPPAWVANRQTAVSSSANLTLLSNGDLSLSDTFISPTPIWSTETPNLGVVRAQLLDTGNLVLLNNVSGIVWQSFLHPTDTLLPGQNFTFESTNLTSNERAGYPRPGRFTFSLSPTGHLNLSLGSQKSYWSHQGNSSSFWYDVNAQKSNITLHSSPSSIISIVIPNGNGPYRLTLDVDGNLRLYSWDLASAKWISIWIAFNDVCSTVSQLCGDYGVCIYNPQPTCVCPPGFSVKDSSLLSGGCVPITPINLDCSAPIKYLEIENVNYPFNDYLNITDISIEECMQRCSRVCECMVMIYSQAKIHGQCWLKTAAQNGFTPGSQKYHVFLKINAADPLVPISIEDRAADWSLEALYQPPAQTRTFFVNNTKSTHTWYKAFVVLALSIMVGAQALCLAAAIAALLRYRRYARLHGVLEDGVSGSLLVYSYQEMEAATENFSHKLGEGGFGTVYKGTLPNGKPVAVKQLKGVSQQEKQFRAEIATIGRIHHINLLRLVGFCSEGSRRLLVYEFMENGSLDQILFQDGSKSSQIKALDWSTRFRICLAVARGIHYLHEECLDCILHCDIKPQNILLDSTYTAKVADFGLAYLYSRDHTVTLSTIRGTRGYLAPEWVSNLPITAKADVYSYGMLVMEIMSGRKNYVYTDSANEEENEKWWFPMWAYRKKAEEVLDAKVDAASVNWEQAESVLKVAFCCIQADMNARPSIGKVVQMLEGILPIPETGPPTLFSHEVPQHYPFTSSQLSSIMKKK